MSTPPRLVIVCPYGRGRDGRECSRREQTTRSPNLSHRQRSPPESRPQTALRRRAAPELAEPTGPYQQGELTIGCTQRTVTLAGRPVELTDVEYRLLAQLSANAGRLLTHNQPPPPLELELPWFG